MSSESLSPAELRQLNDKVRRSWAKQASHYDKAIAFFERKVFGVEHRDWACSRATGKTLEIAVGTGLNLPHYPTGLDISGIDLSPEMLAIARTRAVDLQLSVDLHVEDAHELGFEDEMFDTVVATYSLCNIPDPHRAVAEMKRVLRPGGKLILVDHIRSPIWPIYWLQKLIEFFTRRLEGEHMTRRPLDQVRANGFVVQERERMRAGLLERLVAIKPLQSQS